MITRSVTTEFGTYKIKYNHGFEVHSDYMCIDSYISPEHVDDWMNCPCCNLKPKVWSFDNGRYTACGCWNDKYNHFSICAESIGSVYRRTGMTEEYSGDKLRLNWNEYCATMISSCNHTDLYWEKYL